MKRRSKNMLVSLKNNFIEKGTLVYSDIKKELKDSWEKGPKYLTKDYFAATAGSMIFSFPLVATFLNYVPEIFPFLINGENNTVENSLLKLGGWTLLSGYLVSKGRNSSRRAFEFDEKHNPTFNKSINKHDGIFQPIISAPTNFLNYVTDPNLIGSQIASATFTHSIANIFTGILDGNGVDLMNDLMGIKSSKRMPKYIQNMNPRIKYGLAIGLTLASYASIEGINYSHNYFFPKEKKVSENKLEKTLKNEFTQLNSKQANEFLYPKDIKE